MARTPKPKPLTEKQRPVVEAKWEDAVAEPQNWRDDLIQRVADLAGYRATSYYDSESNTRIYTSAQEQLAAAWGLMPDGRTPLPQFA